MSGKAGRLSIIGSIFVFWMVIFVSVLGNQNQVSATNEIQVAEVGQENEDIVTTNHIGENFHLRTNNTPTTPVTIQIQVDQSASDAGNDGNCSYATNFNEIYFGECNTGAGITSGFRFTNVTIPKGAIISQAYLTFTVDGTYETDLSVRFYGEKIGNSTLFSTGNRPDNRPLTTANIDWSLAPADKWTLGDSWDSPELKTIVQEIISHDDWASGNALSIIVENVNSTNHRRVVGYDRGGEYSGVYFAGNLVVTYSFGECGFGDTTLDTDGDGLADSWETNGYDHDNDCVIDVDLPAMGADPLHKDIFVEMDYMQSPPSSSFVSYQPRQEAIDLVIEAFANAPVSNPDGQTGITLHVDHGKEAIMNPLTGQKWGNLSQSNAILLFNIAPPPQDSYPEVRADNFLEARNPIFRYGIAAHKVGESPLHTECMPGLLGWGDEKSNSMIVYYGAHTGGYPSIFEEAIAFMHELGHLLSLKHGGYDSRNAKPNYLSIMNYSFANNGGLIKNGELGFLDYSRFSSEVLPNLNELGLDETTGITLNGYGTHYYTSTDPHKLCSIPGQPFTLWSNTKPLITLMNANGAIDWDGDDTIEASSVENINGNYGSGGLVFGNLPPIQEFSVLHTRNDWQTIEFQTGDSLLNTTGGALHIPSLAGEITSDKPSFAPYAIKTGTNKRLFVSSGITETHPMTLTNQGLLTTTVLLTVTTNHGWFNAISIPISVTLIPSQSVSYPITLSTPMSATGIFSDQVKIEATPMEAPRLTNITQFKAQFDPMAWFEATPLQGTVPLTVTFTDMSRGDITFWHWDFGNGITSTLANPTHTYTMTGTFTVTLTVSNDYASDTYTNFVTVDVPPTIHTLPFLDDLSQPQQNWQAFNSWLETSQAHSASTAWQGLFGPSALILKDQLDLTTALSPTLFFWQQFTAITGTAQVAITIDEGMTWHPVLTITAPITNWQESIVDLRDFSGHTIGLAFYLREVISPTVHAGWFIDDIEVVPNCATAVSPNDLQINQSGNDVILNWTHNITNEGGYEIWRNVEPYFSLEMTGTLLISTTLIPPFTDNEVIGDTDENYYYVIRGLNRCLHPSSISTQVGEFDQPIEPGCISCSSMSLLPLP